MNCHPERSALQRSRKPALSAAEGDLLLLSPGHYSESRITVPRNRSTQVDATNRERRPGTKQIRAHQLWIRSRLTFNENHRPPRFNAKTAVIAHPVQMPSGAIDHHLIPVCC